MATFKRHKHIYDRFPLGIGISFALLVLIISFAVAINENFDLVKFLLYFVYSFGKIFAAYAISSVITLIVVIFLDIFPKLEDLVTPILDLVQSLPSLAVFPIFIVIFGGNDLVTVLVLVLAMLWPILFSVLNAKHHIREDLHEVAQIYGAKRWKYYAHVFMPLSFPSWVSGSIVAWGEAWDTLIASEIFLSAVGIGAFFLTTGDELSYEGRLVPLFVLLAIIYLLNRLIWVPLLKLSSRYVEE